MNRFVPSDSQICAYQTGAFCTFANHLLPIGHLPIKILAYQTFAYQEFSNKTFAHPDNQTKLKSFQAKTQDIRTVF